MIIHPREHKAYMMEMAKQITGGKVIFTREHSWAVRLHEDTDWFEFSHDDFDDVLDFASALHELGHLATVKNWLIGSVSLEAVLEEFDAWHWAVGQFEALGFDLDEYPEIMMDISNSLHDYVFLAVLMNQDHKLSKEFLKMASYAPIDKNQELLKLVRDWSIPILEEGLVASIKAIESWQREGIVAISQIQLNLADGIFTDSKSKEVRAFTQQAGRSITTKDREGYESHKLLLDRYINWREYVQALHAKQTTTNV